MNRSADPSNASERWQTPPEVWNPLNQEFHFDLDAAADEQTYRVKPYLTDALAPTPLAGHADLAEPALRAAARAVRAARG